MIESSTRVVEDNFNDFLFWRRPLPPLEGVVGGALVPTGARDEDGRGVTTTTPRGLAACGDCDGDCGGSSCCCCCGGGGGGGACDGCDTRCLGRNHHEFAAMGVGNVGGGVDAVDRSLTTDP